MNIIAFPILVPLLFIIILIINQDEKFAKWLGIVGSLILLFVSLYLFTWVKKYNVIVLQMGNWQAPYGITLVVDYLSALMLTISSFLVFTISIYSYRFIQNRNQYSKFYVFFFSLTMGINGSFITGDVFNLYVWFEVMLLSSFVLITMGSKKEQLEGGIKYLALNLISSVLFLIGLGLLYGKTGTLNMAHLAKILKEDQQSLFMNSSAILFFIAFGIKAALFPLFFWLPASYHTPNITVTSLFAGLLTKVGVYSLFRFFTLFLIQNQEFWHPFILVISGLTMVIGGMAASAQYDTRKILSYHIISQIGYMIMGLGIYTPLAIAGGIYFTIHNMIAKTNTFLVSGIISKLKGTFYLKNIGGLYKDSPWLAVLFIIPAFALAGIPPLSGFFAKFILIKAGFEAKSYLIAIVALLTSIFTLYSMIKIWNEAFLKPQPKENIIKKTINIRFSDVLPSIILGLVSIGLGIFAAKIFEISIHAANQLLDTENYINIILNGIQ